MTGTEGMSRSEEFGQGAGWPHEWGDSNYPRVPADHPNAPCNSEYCTPNYDDGWHTNEEHIDPPDRDPYSDAYMEAEKKVNDVFGDHGGWLLSLNDKHE